MSPSVTVRACFGILLALTATACTGFSEPVPFDDAGVRARSVSMEKDGVRASATLLSPEEIESIFGVDLSKKGIQPVWLEIENRTTRPFYFLLSGMDPEYFPPLEVGYTFHLMFSGEANERLDAHLTELSFDNRASIAPGSSKSGFVYANEDHAMKVVNIDVLGEKWTSSLTMYVLDPSDARIGKSHADFEARFSEPELVRVDDAAQLRKAIEGLPCCARNRFGDHVAPLNLVLIGEVRQCLSAGQRRGYRHCEAVPMQAFMRPQDVAAAKRTRWVDAQPNLLRLWQTPLRYRGETVWLAQVSQPRGGRFAEEFGGIDPAFDDARNAVVEDLIYSQQVGRIGFVEGGGCAECRESGVSTDGLRAVLVFEDRPISLAGIDFFDWERIADFR